MSFKNKQGYPELCHNRLDCFCFVYYIFLLFGSYRVVRSDFRMGGIIPPPHMEMQGGDKIRHLNIKKEVYLLKNIIDYDYNILNICF